MNGEPAVTIAITKLPAANTVDVSHGVLDILPDLEQQLDGVTLTVVFDQAPYIEQSIETLAVEGGFGLLFAVLVILLFTAAAKLGETTLDPSRAPSLTPSLTPTLTPSLILTRALTLSLILTRTRTSYPGP